MHAPASTLDIHRARIEAALERLLPPPDPALPERRVVEAMRYSLLAGGKRLRPVLCLAAAEAVGGPNATAADVDRACAAIECVHTYSLIHDDLPAMDDDDLRRGKPTCHRAFDEATAILAGDALQVLAFEMLCEADGIRADTRLALLATLASASGVSGMVGGQAMDLACVGQAVAQPALERMHALKTGALIRAAVRMGGLLGGANSEALDALDRYASAIGLAFQVQDDILDGTGTAAALGKAPGADAARDKPTFLSLMGERAAADYAQALCERAVQALAPFGERAQPLADIARFIVARDR
jgi:geranylgeranyl pyrophosphate synthase